MKKNKLNKIKEIYPRVFELYNHLYNARINGTHNSINILLVLDTFFILIYWQFWSSIFKGNYFLLTPLLFLFVPIFLLLKELIPSKIHQLPWIDKNEIPEFLDKNEFYLENFKSVLFCAQETYRYMINKRKLIKISINSIIFSFISLFIILIVLYIDNDFTKIILIIILLIGFCLLKENLFIQKNLQSKKEFEEINKIYQDWLNEEIIK